MCVRIFYSINKLVNKKKINNSRKLTSIYTRGRLSFRFTQFVQWFSYGRLYWTIDLVFI